MRLAPGLFPLKLEGFAQPKNCLPLVHYTTVFQISNFIDDVDQVLFLPTTLSATQLRHASLPLKTANYGAQSVFELLYVDDPFVGSSEGSAMQYTCQEEGSLFHLRFKYPSIIPPFLRIIPVQLSLLRISTDSLFYPGCDLTSNNMASPCGSEKSG